jgi:CHAT domain-containing protein/Tfp pilus assembly protein PilF
MGMISWKRGDSAKAMDFYRRALEIGEKQAPNSASHARTLNGMACVFRKQGDLKAAREFLQRALSIERSRQTESLDIATTINLLGIISSDLGDFMQAKRLHLEAFEIQQRLAPYGIDIADTLDLLGLLHRDADQPQLAVANDFLQRAMVAAENAISRFKESSEIRFGLREQRSELYRDALGVELRLGRSREAFHTLERFRARNFLEQLAERDTIFTDVPEFLDSERRRLSVRFDVVQQQLTELNRQDLTPRLEGLLGELRRLRIEADDIEERIRSASPKLAALQYPHPLDLKLARENLDPGTLLLSFSVGEGSTFLFTVSKELDLRVDSLPIRGDSLRTKIADFRRLLEQARGLDSPWIERTRDLARRLFSMLIEPISDRIEGIDRVLILADGPLHYLPWGALMRERKDGSQYLIEWKPIHLALSATVYSELRKLRKDAGYQSTHIQLAAFGDPHYTDTRETAGHHDDIVVRSVAEWGIFDWEPLPYSRREVETINNVFPLGHTRVYLGDRATEEIAKALGRDVRIIHFATHAHLDERFPMSSFLALTIPDKYREGEDNGLLQVWEIYERLRIDADLVVLSACESALGEERRGEGLMGLTRAFQYAGARTVAASLWRVADEATGELMVRFYRHLRAGKSKDEALRAAQIELIHGDDERLRLPYYWAAFQIYGDWQ